MPFLAGLTCLTLMTSAPSAGRSDTVSVTPPRRPVHTYSIVARDTETGQLGVAVQSHWFGVGTVVPWAEAGVGAVATQSFVDPAYGPRALGLMRHGLRADQALDALVGQDEGRAVRQVALVDSAGNVAAHTGKRCIDYAGHHTGKGYSVQANLMLEPGVTRAMARAYEEAQGDLATRLLAALAAAQLQGGDVRGQQAAAIVVVRGESSGQPWRDRVVDLRIDDHEAPIAELNRLLKLQRAYREMNLGDAALERSDPEGALTHYAAAAKHAPDHPEVTFWHGVTLATTGQVDEGTRLLHSLFSIDRRWVEVTRRLQKPGVIPNNDEGAALLKRLLQASEK